MRLGGIRVTLLFTPFSWKSLCTNDVAVLQIYVIPLLYNLALPVDKTTDSYDILYIFLDLFVPFLNVIPYYCILGSLVKIIC